MPDPIPVAIIGMGCLFPKSNGLKEYWQLLYRGKDAITEVPASHWQSNEYFDSDPKRPDHVYCKRGGFLDPVLFDSGEFGIPPAALEATDTSQLLGLLAAKMALEDSGYGDGREFDRDRTSVILGVTGTQELVIPLSSRLGYPKWRKALEDSAVSPEKTAEVIQRISDSYVSWQENSFPGLLGNVVAGRICNRLDLRGTNCVVDAACASSLSAVHLALLELASGRSDMVVTGGVDTLNDIFMHMCFSKTHTLSATGDARPFSDRADGTVLGEGIGMLVLKRLADAEKDANRIYAVIKGLGASSDGKSQSIYSPRSEGQVRALRAAYKNAGISPATVQLIEAHGTGTRVGDKVEFEALNQTFDEFGANGSKCALGSVKSMIGHTKASAGAAGLIKAALGLYHKVLPPTLKADRPDPNLNIKSSHFYLNTSTRPWCLHNGDPRRAGVSAFGFGGSNFHVVLEEYRPEKSEIAWDGSMEIIALSAEQPDELIRQTSQLKQSIENGLSDQEFKSRAADSRQAFSSAHRYRLLMTCEGTTDKSDLLARALMTLDPQKYRGSLDLKDIYFGGPQKPGKLAFVFPGQGSQYPGMGRDVVCMFPQAMSILEKANKRFGGSAHLSDLIFPPGASEEPERRKHADALQRTEYAQPAIGAISLAMLKTLEEFGLAPDATCGHSFGELTALCAAGWIDEAALLELSISRGQLMAEAGSSQNSPVGAMLAVRAPLAELEELIAGSDQNVILANRNSPDQGVLSGPTSAIENIQEICRAKKFRAVRLPVSAAFHSEQVQAAAAPFQQELAKIRIKPTAIDVYSNTTGSAYPSDSEAARQILGEHLIRPVDFVNDIESLYRAGVRTFVEIGPRSVLTGLISTILQGRPFEAAAMDASAGRAYGVADLARLICRLGSLGYPLMINRWEAPISKPRKPLMEVFLSGTNYRNRKSEAESQNSEVKNAKPEAIRQNATGGDLPPASGKRYPGNANVPKDLKQHELPSRINHSKYNPTDTIKKAASQAFFAKSSDGPPERMSKNSTYRSDFISDALSVVQEGLRSMQQLQERTALAHEKFLQAQAEANRALQEMMRNTQRLAEKTLGFQPSDISNAPAPELVLQSAPMPDSEIENAASTKADSEGSPIPAGITPGIQPPPSPAPWNQPKATANGYSKNAAEQPGSFDPGGKPEADGTAVAATMLEVVSQLTGYPVEMLGLDMDIEADLGIDSIKRVEILSTLEEKMPDLPRVSPEIMGTLKTLGQIVEFMNGSPIEKDQTGRSADAVAAVARAAAIESPKKAETPANDITTTLLEVVSQLTGYPGEMLGLDMDIEADLGIDSIKRVEILSSLEERMPHLPAVSPEMLGNLKTLKQISEYLGDDQRADTFGNSARKLPPPDRLPVDAVSSITTPVSERQLQAQDLPRMPRSVVTVAEAPPVSEPCVVIPSHRKVFVTEDNSGLSEEITEELSKQDIKTVRVSLDILRYKKQLPEAAGLIIVQDPNSDKIHRDLKEGFALAKFLAPSLIEAAKEGGGLFTTITRLDGAFGLKDIQTDSPAQGGLAGLAKTAALEWEHVCCHAIDIAPDWTDNPAIAAAVAKEVMSRGPIEIGLDAGSRCTLSLKSAPYPIGDLHLTDRDVVVISGGARGVTAAAALELGARTGATLVLLGRSPKPFIEPEWLISIQGEAAVKKAIFKNEFSGRNVPPTQVEQAYRRYIANREISENLARIKSTGATVRYYSADVRDSDAVRLIMDEIRSQHGSISAVIHGAGVLEDRLIIDKTLEQFNLVYDTKVIGLENLLQAARGDSLKYLVLFSSVAARFGNKGQADYAAANEALNKVAQAESARRRDCRVVSINWGPWDGGMVTPALKREFERKDIHLIPPADGSRCLLQEMMASGSDPVEIIIGADLQGKAAQPGTQAKRPALVAPPAVLKKQHHALVFERQLEVDQYPILKSHMIDGKPVVPLALMTEWLAHGALHENPGLIMHGLDEIRVMKGIRLEHKKIQVRLLAGKPQKRGEFFEVEVELRNAAATAKDIIHSKARAVLSDRLFAAPEYRAAAKPAAGTYDKGVAEIYSEILFHGPQLHAIRQIIYRSSKGMSAHISAAPAPSQWMAAPLRNNWIADPLILDGAFQMATVWCFEEKGTVSLPSFAESYRQYCHRLPADGVKVTLEVKEATHRKMRGDFTFFDSADLVVARLTGYEAVMDASLIRAFKPQYRASA